MVALSVLDLVPVSTTPKAALAATIRAAQVAEAAGYCRYWIGESHSTQTFASAATTVLMGQIAAATTSLRVGAGGMMLAHHSPIRVAEDLGTLALLYPNRIEGGLTRGERTATTRQQTNGIFQDEAQAVRKFLMDVPGFYTQVPLCILGASMPSAVLAAKMGVPLMLMSHVTPVGIDEMVLTYRKLFTPSEQCAQSYVIAGANVMVCDSRQEADFQFTTLFQMFEEAMIGKHGLISPPRIVDIHPLVKVQLQQSLSVLFSGTGPDVALRMQQWAKARDIDEIMTVTYTYDPEVRQASIRELGNWF